MYRILIKGKVQGIGFRRFTKTVADSLQMKGYVRNNPDGNVEVLIDTDKKQLAEFTRILKNDHHKALVSEIVIQQEDDDTVFKDFSIAYD